MASKVRCRFTPKDAKECEHQWLDMSNENQDVEICTKCKAVRDWNNVEEAFYDPS